jgi:hypothetical protein
MADLIDLAAIRRAVAAAKAARAVDATTPRRPGDPTHSVAEWEMMRPAVNLAHKLATMTAEQAREVIAQLASEPAYIAELTAVMRLALEHLDAAHVSLAIAVERLSEPITPAPGIG